LRARGRPQKKLYHLFRSYVRLLYSIVSQRIRCTLRRQLSFQSRCVCLSPYRLKLVASTFLEHRPRLVVKETDGSSVAKSGYGMGERLPPIYDAWTLQFFGRLIRERGSTLTSVYLSSDQARSLPMRTADIEPQPTPILLYRSNSPSLLLHLSLFTVVIPFLQLQLSPFLSPSPTPRLSSVKFLPRPSPRRAGQRESPSLAGIKRAMTS
jgi:hypothetical protein